MRTSSSVARGSLPRMRPVIHSSKKAYVAAMAKGICTVGRRDAGDGGHLVEDLLEGKIFTAENVAAARLAGGERGDVGAGNFSDIDEVEAGVDVGRKLAVEEIDEDAAGGCGLCIIWADRSWSD